MSLFGGKKITASQAAAQNATTSTAGMVTISGGLSSSTIYGINASNILGHWPPEKPASMPDSLSNASINEIMKAADAIRHSPVYSLVTQLEHVTNSYKDLKTWEVEQVERAYSNFMAKHGSPLAKALK